MGKSTIDIKFISWYSSTIDKQKNKTQKTKKKKERGKKMAIKTLKTKQVIIEVEQDVARKLPVLAKQRKMKLDDLLVDILEQAVVEVPLPAKRIRRKVVANEPILTEEKKEAVENQAYIG